MTAYTKGPWKKLVSDDGFISIGNDETTYFGPVLGFKQAIADVWREKDADLIAAAPALLNGINGLIGLIQLVCSRDDMPPAIKAALESSWRFDEAKLAAYQAEGK